MKIFYIDPQSYRNLSQYDYSLLSPMTDAEVVYYHSELYQLPQYPCANHRSVFCYSNKGNALAKALSYFASMMSISVDVVRQRPDVVHVQWTRLWLIDCLFAMLVRLLGGKIVHTAHNLLPHHPKRFDKPKCKAYYHLMNAVIVHTKRTATELARDFGIDEKRINVIHHGVLKSVVDEGEVAKQMARFREQIGVKDGDFVFSCPGYQYKYKGVETLAEVWCGNACFSNNANAHLLLVGKNKDVPSSVFDKLKALKNVFVLDELTSDVDFEAYLRMSSVVMLPYKTISQSGLLFTALCSGVPVAVSDVGGLAEPLQQAKVGWCMGQSDADSLKAMMLYLFEHQDEVAEVRIDKSAFATIIDQYSWQRISADTLHLYRSLM